MSEKISVSLIVKNEESCLAKCLESVKHADEIVIVDTGSTDRTVEIAKTYTDKVYSGEEFLWRDDFAFSRNQSLARCTGDWILIVDADEELEPGVLPQLAMDKVRSVIARCDPKFKTIECQTISKKGGEKHLSTRLFRRCPEVFWKGAIHNHLSVSEQNVCDVRVEFGYSEAHKLDPDRALRICQKEMERDPKLVREAYYLAREYYYRKDYATAIKWYEDYLTRAKWAPEMADAWLMIAYCRWNLKDGSGARDAALQAIKINANFKEAIVLMAKLSGPKNAVRWRAFAETANNDSVLFERNVVMPANSSSPAPVPAPVPAPAAGAPVVYFPHADQAKGTFQCGDGCEFGGGTRIDGTGDVLIGEHCLFLRNVKVHTHRHAFMDGNVPDVTKEHGITPTPLIIGSNVVIAEGAVVMPGVALIGDNAIVGAYSVLTHMVGPGEVWAGNPARHIRNR